jgi:hypothetical protein
LAGKLAKKLAPKNQQVITKIGLMVLIAQLVKSVSHILDIDV